MTNRAGSGPGASSGGYPLGQRAEPVTQDLGQFQEAHGRPVGQGQEPLAGCPGLGHRRDVQVGHVTHVGDAETLTPHHR
jgi:hypothetical protein